MKKFVLVPLLIVITACAPSASYGGGPNCTIGKPCGNTCISRDKTCRIGDADIAEELLTEHPGITGT
ncbi:hypothetical protein [Deinococcus peraridilitoris]|uniref:Uncharacterized protein n=1 Tax=Deinococcus peraridilitoris (strain DSM 19664 / LMG 22246 / CIP 109416 / KR-200) TaxID=937777 RepID=L0A1F1_DEIPD|nr:hypothetical protein [Deinococcus peraridilitoris]AFZ67007.1 hypothetical protein Deipe_1466 [Deinococcus peraridilitoris DSM 19664]